MLLVMGPVNLIGYSEITAAIVGLKSEKIVVVKSAALWYSDIKRGPTPFYSRLVKA